MKTQCVTSVLVSADEPVGNIDQTMKKETAIFRGTP